MSQHQIVSTVNRLMANLTDDLRDLDGTLSPSDDNEDTNFYEPVVPEKIQGGLVVQVHGLTSAVGQKLNGGRCAIIRYVETESRWEVRMENQNELHPMAETVALKEQNLKILPRLPLPKGPTRGRTPTGDPRKLCELLLYYKGASPDNPDQIGVFKPSDIMLTGYAASCLTRYGENNLMFMVPVQMEQVAGVLALAKVCVDYDEGGAESVLFALLEGNPMYIDVLILTMTWVGLIVNYDENDSSRDNEEFRMCPPTQLTPDQDEPPYVRFMTTGPVRLLVEMTKHVFGEALWAAMRESEFHHLLVQRLLRWIAREGLGTADGKKIGPQARLLLVKLVPGVDEQKKRISKKLARDICEKSSSLRQGTISPEHINELFLSQKET